MGIKITGNKLGEDKKAETEKKANEWFKSGMNQYYIAEILANEHKCSASTYPFQNDIIISLK